MFNRILFPTDGSQQSLAAARTAAELAKVHDATVFPLVAVGVQHQLGGELPENVATLLAERVAERAAAALSRCIGVIREVGARCEEGKHVDEHPAEAILREAVEGEFDLIVMASRGVSLDRGQDRMLGSVTERVLHSAACPVLVIRKGS
jgi:nucleotide-binding universal stress UspA family protein